MKLTPHTAPYMKINSEVIIGLRVRVKAIEALQESQAINVVGFHWAMVFFGTGHHRPRTKEKEIGHHQDF